MNENLAIYVKKFQNGLINKRDFLKHVNPLILNIPFYLGCKSVDIKYEFYAHIISKIEKLISFYKELPYAKFTTWFHLVLKREFYYFISKINKINDFESLQINDAIINFPENTQPFSDEINNAPINLTQLTEKEKNVIALKYGIKIYERDISKSVDKILSRLDKKRNLENKISRKYFKILNLQTQISKSDDNDKINNLRSELQKVINYKRKLEKAYYSFSIFPTNKWVGEQLGLSEGTIGAYLNKIKSKLMENKKDK